MEPNIALSLSGLEGRLTEPDAQDALDAFMNSQNKPDYTTYFNTTLVAASPNYVAMRQNLKAVQTPDEVKLISIDQTDDNTLTVTEYNTAVKSVDFVANTVDFGVKDQFAYAIPEKQPEPEKKAEPAAEAKGELKTALAETLQDKAPAQEAAKVEQPAEAFKLPEGGHVMFEANVNNFIKTYCSSNSGVVYTSVDSLNYKQILNGYSAWSAMSQEDRNSVNSLLAAAGSSRFQDLYISANQVRLGLANNSLGGTGSAAAVKTAAIGTASDSHQTRYWTTGALFGSLAVFFGYRYRKESDAKQ